MSMIYRSMLSVALLGAAVAFGACSTASDARECNVGADCASGACAVNGQCVAVEGTTPDAGAAKTDGAVSVTPTDGGPVNEADGQSFPTVDAGGCVHNNDGTIAQSEVPLAAGLSATFKVATAETVDTAGVTNPDGTRTWDFTGALASDQNVIVNTLALTGAWYAKDFTSGTYASKLVQADTTLGIFDSTGANALTLLGVVSPTSDGVTETELTYATPIPILQFPFTKGSTWTTTSNVTGTLDGVETFYTEKYVTSVDATGTVKTPFANFPALRVGTVLTQTVGIEVTTTRTFAWVTECYGTIAKATSNSNETTAEFTQAAELMRLTP